MAWKRHKQYRLQGYDYSGEGAYFITIITKDRAHHFGEIMDGVMQLSPIGRFLEDFVQDFKLHKESFHFEEWQVMPNHVHIILTISPADDRKTYEAAIGLQPLVVDSVSSCINHLKGKVKRWCNENGFTDFQWQARFHDQISFGIWKNTCASWRTCGLIRRIGWKIWNARKRYDVAERASGRVPT